MAETYTWHARDCHVEGSILDVLASLGLDGAADGDRLEVLRVQCLPAGDRDALNSAPGNVVLNGEVVQIVRADAAVGGTAAAIGRFDTSATDHAASALECVVDPDAVTSPSVLRNAPLHVYGTTIATVSLMQNTAGSPNWNNTWRRQGSSDAEGFVLRAGECLALVAARGGNPRVLRAQVVFTVGGSTYVVSTKVFLGGGGGHCWRVPTRPGRGRGVPAVQIALTEMGAIPAIGTRATPLMRLAFTNGVAACGTAEALPRSHGGGVAAASIQAVRGPARALLLGEQQGTPVDWYSTHVAANVTTQQRFGVVRQYIQPLPQRTAGSTSQWWAEAASRDEGIVFSARPGSGLVVRPGQALALLVGMAGTLDPMPLLYDVSFTFLRYPGRRPSIGLGGPLLRGAAC